MYRSLIIIISKSATDVFGYPDFYTIILSNFYKAKFSFISASIICDIMLGQYIGTFFFIDFVSFFLWKLFTSIFFVKPLLILYLIRYSVLFYFSLNLYTVLSQIFFSIILLTLIKIFRINVDFK